MCSFCALHAQLPIWYTLIRQVAALSTLKIKTLITYLCSLIISDSVAVEIFASGQPCVKIFRKVRCATFLRHGVESISTFRYLSVVCSFGGQHCWSPGFSGNLDLFLCFELSWFTNVFESNKYVLLLLSPCRFWLASDSISEREYDFNVLLMLLERSPQSAIVYMCATRQFIQEPCW